MQRYASTVEYTATMSTEHVQRLKRRQVQQRILKSIETYFLHAADSFFTSNRFSASQEISSFFLCNSKFHYRIHEVPATCPYPEPARSSAPTSYILKIHLNIILPSSDRTMPRGRLSFLTEMSTRSISWG